MRYLCNKSKESFCFVCGKFTPAKKRKRITESVSKAYKNYFKMCVNNNKPWCPETCCERCRRCLLKWLSGNNNENLPFSSPMVWVEPKDHSSDCYICCTSIKGFSNSTRNSIRYCKTSSSALPVLRCPTIPPPIFARNKPKTCVSPDLTNEIIDTGCDPLYHPGISGLSIPQVLTQEDLENEVRTLNLPKSTATKFASRLKSKNLLAGGTRTCFRFRQKDIERFYKTVDGATYCHDVHALLGYLNRPTEPSAYRYI